MKRIVMLVTMMGCLDFGVQGNGKALSVTRSVEGFSAVDADVAIDVVIVEDPTTSVVVETDSNLAPLITTTVQGSTLVIRQTRDFTTRATSVVTVHVPALGAADSGGAGSMFVSGFAGAPMHLGLGGSGAFTGDVHPTTLDVSCHGSGSMTVTGHADALTLDLSGSGSLDAKALAAGGAKASLSGSGSAALVSAGDATLDISGSGSFHAELDAGRAWLGVSGSGSIDWSGTSAVVAQNITGSGSIVHR